MLTDILKKMDVSDEVSKKVSGNSQFKNGKSYFSRNTGFHAKKNSQIGAARQRSIGNRNYKSSTKAS